MDVNPQSYVRKFSDGCIIHSGILDCNAGKPEIADYLGFSPNTVKTYLSRIYEKMNINKRDELKNYMLK